MPNITLPNGDIKKFNEPLSVKAVAASIGSGLAKSALAGEVNGQLVDIEHLIAKDAELKIITAKDEQGLDIIRHSTAHLLAHAVKRLYPQAQVSIGPVIENGFYYDFYYPPGFAEEDLVRIEAEMKKITSQNITVTRLTKSRDEAIDFFKALGEDYKTQIISDIDNNEILSFYQQDDFIDLCRGPHVPHTGKLQAFKLMSVAGAYWRGDSNNEMLQRIYGTAWRDKKELNAYLTRLEEAKKRDHRKIGKTQDLFHTQEEAPGMVFWHSKGWQLYQIVEQYMRQVFVDNDYQEVHTPQVMDKTLWQQSGHWDKFSDVMFTTQSERREYAIKPMNCPAHVLIYNQGLKSYKDLPLRMAEFGSCHRNEASGTLHGLMRVRNFVQDDGHIFCTPEQILEEALTFIDLTYQVYEHFGFDNIEVKLSTRPDERVGSDEVWDKAEQALAEALNHKKLSWQIQPGEGAFYGPKVEFILKDCLDRAWQCGTVQVDFSIPERLNASYIDENGNKQTPVMLHRAILGSLERFIGILIEHYGGAYPVWLAPVQAVIINISQAQTDFALTVEKTLKKANVRVFSDLRNEKIGFKIREHSMQRYPYIIIIGNQELENRCLSVRKRGGEDLGSMSIDDFITRIKES